MAAPAMPSPRRRKSAAASRYLEAIQIQCGGGTTNVYDEGNVRGRPIPSRNNNDSRTRTRTESRNGNDGNRTSTVNINGMSCSGNGYTPVPVASGCHPVSSSGPAAKAFRSTPIDRRSGSRTTSTFKTKSSGNPQTTQSVYEKISVAGKAADCSRSILTASTAMMADPSYDSISTSTTTNSPGGIFKKKQNNKKKGSSPTRPSRRRGRSPTQVPHGTNSISSSTQNRTDTGRYSRSRGNYTGALEHRVVAGDKDDDDDNDIPGIPSGNNKMNHRDTHKHYRHQPGTQTTAPLSGESPSIPRSPHRLHSNLTTTPRKNGGNSPCSPDDETTKTGPMTPFSVESTSGINEDGEGRIGSHDDDSEDSPARFLRDVPLEEEQHEHENENHVNEHFGDETGSTSHYYQRKQQQPRSFENRHSSKIISYPGSPGKGLFPKTNPRMPDSPGQPRPNSPSRGTGSLWKFRQAQQQRQQQHRQKQQQQHAKPDLQPHAPWSPSEPGAPTEVARNFIKRHFNPYPLSRSMLTTTSPSHSDILSKVRNRFQQTLDDPSSRRQQQIRDSNAKEEDEIILPSLLDTASSSVSSASVLGDQPGDREPMSVSKLTRHVENARKQSILSSCGSETTDTASRDNVASYLDAKYGTNKPNGMPSQLQAPTFSNKTARTAMLRSLLSPPDDDNSGENPRAEEGQQQTPKQSQDGQPPVNTTTANKPIIAEGGLRRRPMGAQVKALAAHYRRGRGTARGAQNQHQQRQDHGQECEKVQTEHQQDPQDLNVIISYSKSSHKVGVPNPIMSLTAPQVKTTTVPDSILSLSTSSHSPTPMSSNFILGIQPRKEQGENSKREQSFQPEDIRQHEGIDEDDESTLPEYDSERNGSSNGMKNTTRSQEFVSYNERASPNTADVFQSKGISLSKKKRIRKKENGRRHESQKNAKTRSRGRDRDRRGKSPIQPLFSSERLDETNDSSIRESSIRSKSLGRTMTSEQFMRMAKNNLTGSEFGKEQGEPPPRRSKSLSQREGRKPFHASIQLSQAMRAMSTERKNRLQRANERVNEDGEAVKERVTLGNEESLPRPETGPPGASSHQKGLPTIPNHISPSGSSFECDLTPSGTFPLNESAASPKPTGKTEFSTFRKGTSNDLKSIKDKIRSYNLKRSPKRGRALNRIASPEETSPILYTDHGYSSSSQSSFSAGRSRHCRKSPNATKSTEEEKKEEERNILRKPSGNSFLDRLQRRYVKAQYFGEGGEDESHTPVNDEFSVQSLRERFEQSFHSRQTDEEVANDRSVRNLKEMFESPNNHKGETVNNLRAKFERPKSRSLRSSFLNDNVGTAEMRKPLPNLMNSLSMRHHREKNSRLPNQRGQRQDKAKSNHSKGKERNPSHVSNESRAESSSNGSYGFVSRGVPGSYSTAPGQGQIVNNDIKGNLSDSDFSDAVTLDPSYVEVSLLSNSSPPSFPISSWSAQGRNCGLTKKDTKEASTESGFSDAVTLDPTVADVSRLSHPSTYLSTPRVPGSHWTEHRGSFSGQRNELEKNDTKGASADSDFSDAVTLDPSYAEVSVLTTPSPIRSIPSNESDRNSDLSQSLLLGNLEKKFIKENDSATQQLSFEDISNDSETNYEEQPRDSAVPGTSSKHKYRKPDLQRQPSLKMYANERVPDSCDRPYARRTSESSRSVDKRHTFAHSSGHSSSSMFASRELIGSSSRSQRSICSDRSPARSPIRSKGNSRDLMQSISRSPRSRAIPPVSPESPNQSSRSHRPSQVDEYSRQATISSEQSCQSTEYSHREIESSASRLVRSMDRDRQAYDSSYRSSRAEGNPHPVVDMSNLRSPGMQGYLGSNNFQSKSSDWLSHNSSPHTLNLALEERYSENQTSSRNPVANEPAPPDMPSPFDENYAIIMESRHKMLLSRQRTLLSRRANRGKLQSTQQQQHQGFIGKFRPNSPPRETTSAERSNSHHSRATESSLSPSRKETPPRGNLHTAPQPGGSSSHHSRNATKPSLLPNQEEIPPRGNLHSDPQQGGSKSYHCRRSKPFRAPSRQHHPRSPSGTWSGNEAPHKAENCRPPIPGLRISPERGPPFAVNHNEATKLPPKHQVAPVLFTTQPAFRYCMALPPNDRHEQQKKAVLDRLSAVRAARLRRNHVYGDASGNASCRNLTSQKLEPIHNSSVVVSMDNPNSGYRYYPHNDVSMEFQQMAATTMRNRDDDTSLATNESNAQEYATKFAMD